MEMDNSIGSTKTEPQKSHNKRKQMLWILTAFFSFVGLLWFLYWLVWARFEEYTNDAYVNGNLIYITPQVSGIITEVYVQDTDYVLKDHILVQLDKTDFLIALEKRKAELAESVRKVAQLFTTVAELEAMIEVKKAQLKNSAQDFERRKKLVDSGGVSQEDYTHAANTLAADYFSLMAVEQQYFTVSLQIYNTTVATHPLVEQAKQAVKEAWIELKRCTIYAPASGIIAKKVAQVGERAKAAEPILAVVPLDQIWVDANFKEVQIGKMQVGQKATLKADMYGRKVEFHGTVVGLAGGTGSVFSVLPPQNATGNWIKIVQRLPVRIDLPSEEIQKHPLRLGVSLEVTVDIHNIDGPVIPKARENKPLFETSVFANEEAGVDDVIDQIIASNIPPHDEEP